MRELGRSVQTLVEEQVRRWELRRRARPERPVPEPVVTVSRLPGCAGRDIARRVAGRMGFAFYDKELLHRIAKDAGLSEAIVSSLDEKSMPALDEWISWLVLHRRLSGEFFKHLSKVMLSIARHGRAVLLGRGGSFIVPPRERLSVLLVAEREFRVRGLARRAGLSPEEARRLILRVESDRRDFIRRNFGAEMTDPVHYDLSLNVEGLGADGAVDIIEAAWLEKRRALSQAPAPGQALEPA